MNEYVQVSVDARRDFFGKYYTVPIELQEEVEAFIQEICELGEKCSDTMQFEQEFVSCGLSERFNELLARCNPKAYQMTEEEKKMASDTAKEIFKEDKSRILKEAVEDVVDSASVMAKEELTAMRRKTMIELDVYDDYTRVSNAVEYAKDAASYLGGLFKKKKK